MARKKGPLNPLQISMPPQMPQIAVALQGNDESTLSSAASESDYPPFSSKPRSLRNMKKLSLSLPSAQSSTTSLNPPSEPQSAISTKQPELPQPLSLAERRRRSSVISLPTSSTPAAAALYHRKEHEGDPAVPYADGPVQILPGIWLGSEDNARDWKGLIEKGIKAILNVAKEVNLPFDSVHHGHPLRSSVSSPNLNSAFHGGSTYYPPHVPSGRPGMHYLKLQWSHGQQDLVANGFQEAMTFTDAAIERGEGVLIHCQCGISRSATMVIALVMRAAAERSPSVPSEIWALKGMQGAYDFVKGKSSCIGPNMSLIYQLLDYERKLSGVTDSPSTMDRSPILVDEEEEWGRRRKLMDEEPASPERESDVVLQEAQALDKAMEDRIEARRASAPSIISGGVGMGSAWKSRYGGARKRTGSIASNMTNGSILSEDLVEEDEERELLHSGVGFDSDKTDGELTSSTTSPDDSLKGVSPTATRHPVVPPPSAPIWKTSFSLPPPPFTAAAPAFDLSKKAKGRKRPVSLSLLPPVPPSPIQIILDAEPEVAVKDATPKKKIPSSLHLKTSGQQKASRLSQMLSPVLPTPSQTLFVFPPSPTQSTRTPSTMTISNNMLSPVISTPRVSMFRSQGRTKSFIGLGAPPTPTTAFSKVDAKGYFGLDS